MDSTLDTDKERLAMMVYIRLKLYYFRRIIDTTLLSQYVPTHTHTITTLPCIYGVRSLDTEIILTLLKPRLGNKWEHQGKFTTAEKQNAPSSYIKLCRKLYRPGQGGKIWKLWKIAKNVPGCDMRISQPVKTIMLCAWSCCGCCFFF